MSEILALTIEPADPIGETARELIHALCSEMSERYGAPPSPFSPSEASAPRTVFLMACLAGHPVGCGALRRFDDHTAEIKRMYVAPAGRRKGIARGILVRLERHAQDFGYRAIRLETGIRQPEAQRLYESLGYRHIAAFGPYVGNPTSVCYERVFHDSSGSRQSEHHKIMNIPFTGGCVCGAVRYECSAKPILMFKCHCRDCQRVTGGAFVAGLLVPNSAFRLTKGQLRYHFTSSLAGGKHKRSFCPECGSRLTGGESDERPTGFIGITAGTLDDPAWFQPTMDIFTCDAQPWDRMDANLPKYEQYPPM